MRFLVVITVLFSIFSAHAGEKLAIETLLERQFLDDYYSNVVFGYKIVTDTPKYAQRYVGNQLNCSSCHLQSGTVENAIPLNVAGLYPKWRDDSGNRNGTGMRIRECFAYNQNGVMPPETAPEVLAVAAYISYLSDGEIIGQSPKGRGVPKIEISHHQPDPANGQLIYTEHCLSCHHNSNDTPTQHALWGEHSYNKGSSMNKPETLAGYIWANKTVSNQQKLSHEQALDVAAFINQQPRPDNPDHGRLTTARNRIPPPDLSQRPNLETLLSSETDDEFYQNVVLGYNIVNNTQQYAKRYTGNSLNCTNCHLNAGRTKDAIPLNVTGIYPKWRNKNGRRNGIGLRIRECFAFSHNGIMPTENAPEVLAVAAYISYLSVGEVIGVPPEGQGTPTLPSTAYDPNPANGKEVYITQCAACHQHNGEGMPGIPPLWGMDSYNKGAGMNQIQKSASFIWANMPLGMGKTLSHQQALDVAAFLNLQIRPSDPREHRMIKILEDLVTHVSMFFNKNAEQGEAP